MNTDGGNGQSASTETLQDREELFPEEDGDIVNTMDVTRKIWTIRLIEKQIEQYELQDAESRAYYARKKTSCNERIDFIKGSIHAFLNQHNLQRLQTPNGTAYFRSITLKQWPSDDMLLAWAQAYLPEAIRCKLEPDKRAIGEHIKSTGEAPDGYAEQEETRLYIK